LTDGVQLCLRALVLSTVVEDTPFKDPPAGRVKVVKSWRLVNEADLAAWGESQAEAELRGLRVAKKAWASNPPKLVEVEGVGRNYLLVQGEEGQDALALLEPAHLSSLLGAGPVAVGVPVSGTLLAWRAGDPTLDKILGVGIRRIYDEVSAGLSPSLYQEGVEGWQVWAVIQGDVNPKQAPNGQMGQEVVP
jgi:hypothetical protein